MGVLVAMVVLLTAAVASAHVTVWPKVSAANGFERYTIRVPNEKDNPTVKVRVELPAGTTFSGVLPVPGWSYATEKDASGKVIAVVWSAGQIKPGEFMEFGVSVRNPKDAGTVFWKAYQTYGDGTVVEWTGAAGADTPAPTVTLSAAAATGEAGHGDTATTPAPSASGTAPATPAPAPAPSTAAPAPASNNLGAWLGGAALLISLLALGLAARKK
jgi:uncharacterized protein YcnI